MSRILLVSVLATEASRLHQSQVMEGRVRFITVSQVLYGRYRWRTFVIVHSYKGFSDVPLMVHFPCRFGKEFKDKKASACLIHRNSVEDPGSSAFLPLDPGSISGARGGSKIRIRDEHPRSFCRELRNSFLGLKIFKFLYAIVDQGSRIFFNGMENSDAGPGINIPDPQRCIDRILERYGTGSYPFMFSCGVLKWHL